MSTHRPEARRTNGDLWEWFYGKESELRRMAEGMGAVNGQKSWRFDLYEGSTLKATYRHGIWKEEEARP